MEHVLPPIPTDDLYVYAIVLGIALILGLTIFFLKLLMGKGKNLRNESLIVLLLLSTILIGLHVGSTYISKLRSIFHIFIAIEWVVFAFWLTQIIDYYLWKNIAEIPAFLKLTVSFLIYLIAIAGILFQMPNAEIYGATIGIFATVFPLVVLILARGAYEDIIAGFILSIKPLFKKNDAINIEGTEYIVIDLDWRYIILDDYNGNRTYIPNNKVLNATIMNFSEKSSASCLLLTFRTNTNIPPQLVLDILTNKLLDLPMLQYPDPIEIDVKKFDEFGILYEVGIKIVDYAINLNQIRTNASKIIWYALRSNNIPLSMYDTKIHYATSEDKKSWSNLLSFEEVFKLLRNVLALKNLPDEDISRLAKEAIPKEFIAPQHLITQGEKDNTLYVIARGNAHVALMHANYQEERILDLVAGDAVGIMALLTGEPRSAHVIADSDVLAYAIQSDSIKPVLEKHPYLLKELAENIEIMAKEDERAHKHHKKVERLKKIEREKKLETLIGKIRNFFGLEV